jgi:hypothetical protein
MKLAAVSNEGTIYYKRLNLNTGNQLACGKSEKSGKGTKVATLIVLPLVALAETSAVI